MEVPVYLYLLTFTVIYIAHFPKASHLYEKYIITIYSKFYTVNWFSFTPNLRKMVLCVEQLKGELWGCCEFY